MTCFIDYIILRLFHDTHDLRVLPSLKKPKLTVMQVMGRDVILRLRPRAQCAVEI